MGRVVVAIRRRVLWRLVLPALGLVLLVPLAGTVDANGTQSDRYRVAADLLATWRESGVLIPDERPSFTLYRLGFTDETGTAREIVGVLGGLEVVDQGAGGVLPHERTTPKASTDRLDLTRTIKGKVTLTQQYQKVSGSGKTPQGQAITINGRLRGNDVTFSTGQQEFTGVVKGNVIEGTQRQGGGQPQPVTLTRVN